MITVALSATIGAPQERVWRALNDPTERQAWDERILGEVGAARSGSVVRARRLDRRKRSSADAGDRPGSDPSAPGTALRETRWRFRLAGVPQVMKEAILAADPNDRLVSRVAIGSVHFDQTLTLHGEDDETGPRTRLGMKLVARNSIAVLGDVVPRLDVQKLVMEYVDTTLRQVQKYCEADA